MNVCDDIDHDTALAPNHGSSTPLWSPKRTTFWLGCSEEPLEDGAAEAINSAAPKKFGLKCKETVW